MSLRVYIKKFLPRTLYGRALLIIVSPLILLQVVSTWIFYDRHWDTITWRLATSITGDIAMVIDQIRRDPESMETVFDSARLAMDLSMVYRPGEILPNEPVDTFGLLDRLLVGAMNERVKKPFRIDSSSFTEEVIIDVQLPDGILTVIVPGRRVFSSTTYIFIMWMVGTSLVLFAVASVFMRNQIRPIRRLAVAVDSFGKGRDTEIDFKPEGATEVRQAAQAFNLMSQRIRRQIRQRTDMLSGVSHDLRTPLTRMKLQLAMLNDSPEIDELGDNVQEMEKMIDGYLTFARGEGGEKSVETDLTDLVAELADQWRRNGLSIDHHSEGRIVTWLKPESFRRCIDNLLANARRYAEHVWVQVGRRGDRIEVVIDDDGPGIPEEEYENAFRPFYRLDRSRNPDTGGTGLGLAIARDIVRVHGGDIVLEKSPHGGLRVRVGLPV